ncbi:MAG: transposase [Candidatus Roizmanbacteria bacterium]
MNKFQNTYHIGSPRLKGYNYAENGSYYITICTKNRESVFGEIIDGSIQLSEIGNIASIVWQQIPEQFPFATLGEFVIMPNHVHGIITICRDAINRVSTTMDNRVSTHNGGITANHNPMLQENVSTIIRWYKGRTTFEIHKQYKSFAWQPLFYDRIIRDEDEFDRISLYIQLNPINWKKDKNNVQTRL